MVHRKSKRVSRRRSKRTYRKKRVSRRRSKRTYRKKRVSRRRSFGSIKLENFCGNITTAELLDKNTFMRNAFENANIRLKAAGTTPLTKKQFISLGCMLMGPRNMPAGSAIPLSKFGYSF